MENFISAKPIIARVKEAMKSYLQTNSIDDLMFSTWTRDCLDKFHNTYLPIESAVIDLVDGRAELPCDFKGVREVWVTATTHKGPVNISGSFYYQTDCRINPAPQGGCGSCVPGYQCFPPSQTPTPVALPSLCNVPPEFVVTHKVNHNYMFSFHVTEMLRPGNFKTAGKLPQDCPNRTSVCLHTFDLTNTHIITSFSTGTIYLLYYADPLYNEEGFPEIPDVDEFKKYMEWYLRFQCYQTLYDQSTGEEFQLIKAKREDAENRMNSAYVNARNYSMSESVYDIQAAIIRSYNRHDRFIIF